MAQLCLGTVQFGMDYGINNISGQPSEEEVFKILDLAVGCGIEVFDTAAAYGNAEELLGRYRSARQIEQGKFKVVSKLCQGNIEGADNVEEKLFDEVHGSLERLRAQKLHGYLLHKAECIYDQAMVAGLHKIKQNGLVENIGISIYNVSEGEAAIESGIIDFVQMPYNVFDHRGDSTGFLKRAKEKGITTFTRSAFLQGLFMMEYGSIPKCLEKAKHYLCEFEDLLKEFHLEKINALLNFPANNPYIDYVVIGVDNARQLQEHVGKFGEQLPDEFIHKVHQMFRDVEDEIIMPNLWHIGEK